MQCKLRNTLWSNCQPLFDSLLQPEVQQFIRENENAALDKLLLSGKTIAGVAMSTLVEQIVSRQKAQQKTPFLLQVPKVIFPPKLSMEQCSSEITASYKAHLVEGATAVDLTGGAGIDTYFFSKRFKQIAYVESNLSLAQLTKHNFEQLKANAITTHVLTAEAFLSKSKEGEFDFVYIDPARRDSHKKKVFRFSDCTPNVVQLKEQVLKKTKQFMIKASPLVDIKLAVEELGDVKEVHVVAVNNECKELLFLIENGNSAVPLIYASHYSKSRGWEKVKFSFAEERTSSPEYALPQRYLYEPNAALLKAGTYKTLALRYGVYKLHPNTHLYTSEHRLEQFPGRSFEVLDVLKYDKKALALALPSLKANLTCRNFPETVQQIRKKTKITEGGEDYLFATTDMHENKIILHVKKMNTPDLED